MTTQGNIGNILLRAARSAPRLSVDEEKKLVSRYRGGDQAAFGHLIIANVRLVLRSANQLRGYAMPLDDLVQEGVVGLLEAATRFDAEREVRFSSYAVQWVKSAMLDFVFRNWSIVRTSLSSEQKGLFFRLRGLKAKLLRDPAIDPAMIHAAIAAAMGVPVREVEAIDARLAGGDVSLNAPAPWDEDGEAEIGDTLSMRDTLFDEQIDLTAQESALRVALSELDETERTIVQERWLTDDVAPLDALAEWFCISAARVKRIEIAAIEKLQLAVARQQISIAVGI